MLANAVIASNVIQVLINSPFVEFINTYFHFHLIEKDKDDNKFVDCAVAANARFIVSEDRHFDALKSCDFPKVDVIGIDLFAELLKSKPYVFSGDSPTMLNEPVEPYGG